VYAYINYGERLHGHSIIQLSTERWTNEILKTIKTRNVS